MPDYIGIDYAGHTTVNRDLNTGIRYRVISQNSCNPEAVDDIFQNGEDIAFKEAKKDFLEAVVERVHHWFNNESWINRNEKKQREAFKKIVKDRLESLAGASLAEDVAEETTENWGKTSTREEIIQEAEAAVDNHFGDHYESDGGLNDYLYEKDGYKLTGCLQTDIFVLKSEFYTYAQFCSPCVPGACNSDHPVDPLSGAPRSYCLGHSWFEDEKAPYRMWRVSDHVEVLSEVGEVTCGHCNGTGRDSLARVARVRGCEISDLDRTHFYEVNETDLTFQCIRCGGSKVEKQTVETDGEIDPNFKETDVAKTA